MAVELVKENIAYEQISSTNYADNILKPEFVIPDTHPDVVEILTIEAKPTILNSDILQDKIHIEGQIKYYIVYLTMDEDKKRYEDLSFTEGFHANVDLQNASAMNNINAEIEPYIEHIECNIINERKIGVRGLMKTKVDLYQKYNLEVVRDIEGSEDVQVLRSPAIFNKVLTSVNSNLLAKATMTPVERNSAIQKILRSEVSVHNSNVKISEGQLRLNISARINVLYYDGDGEIRYIEDDAQIDSTTDLNEISNNSELYTNTDYRVEEVQCTIQENDDGIKNVIEFEALIKAETRIFSSESIDIVEDAYSPSVRMEMSRKYYDLNLIHDVNETEALIKESFPVSSEKGKLKQVVMSSATAAVTDIRLLENKVVAEGVIKVNCIYKTSGEDIGLMARAEELPFTVHADIQGCKINMTAVCKVNVEDLVATAEAGAISVKAVIKLNTRVSYDRRQELIIDIESSDDISEARKSSITIYATQPGDTLWKVAKKYFTTVEAIQKLNLLEGSEDIKLGQKLIVPGRAIF